MHISSLGDHLLLEIFQKLSYEDVCCRVRLICKHWYKLSHDFTLWTTIKLAQNNDRMKIVTDSILLTLLKNNCSKIHKINVLSCTMLTDVSFLFIADNCPHLMSLNVAFTNISDKALTEIITKCPKLQHLNILGCRKLSLRIFRQFSDLVKLHVRVDTFYTTVRSMEYCNQSLREVAGRCPYLEFFDGRNSAFLSNDTVVEFVTKCPKLRSLKLDQCTSLTSDCVVKPRKKLANLKYISLANCGITDEAVVSLAETCPLLTHLNISATNVQKTTDASLLSIAMHCERLEYLDIHSAEHLHACQRISDAGVVAVASHCKKLRHLNISNCSRITDTSLLTLAKHCLLLQHLEVRNTPQTSSAGLNAVLHSCLRLLHLDAQKCISVREVCLDERFAEVNIEGAVASVSGSERAQSRDGGMDLERACFAFDDEEEGDYEEGEGGDYEEGEDGDYVEGEDGDYEEEEDSDYEGQEDVKEKHDDEVVMENGYKISKPPCCYPDLTGHVSCIHGATGDDLEDDDQNVTSGFIDQSSIIVEMKEWNRQEGCGATAQINSDEYGSSAICGEVQEAGRGFEPIVVHQLEYASRHFPMQLQSLDLSHCSRVTDATLYQIGDHCHYLKCLYLKELPLISDSGVCQVIPRWPYLESINLSCWQCSPSDISDLTLVKLSKCCPRLKSAIVWGTLQISDVGVSQILECCQEMREIGITVDSDCILSRDDLLCTVESCCTLLKCEVHNEYYSGGGQEISNVGRQLMKKNLLIKVKV